MTKLHAGITKVHRACAALFLLTLLPAGYASFTGDAADPSPLVYLPLPFLFVLILTGTYQLLAPWIRKARARRAAQGPSS